MTPTSDPRQRLLRSAAVVLASGVVAVAVVAVWTFQPLPVPPALAASPPLPPPPPITVVNPTRWAVVLWRPFQDAAPPVVVAPVSPLRLFSILRRGDTWIAALDPGNGNALVYARAGDAVPGATVVTVDARGIELRSGTGAGTSRLELER